MSSIIVLLSQKILTIYVSDGTNILWNLKDDPIVMNNLHHGGVEDR